MSEAHRGLDVSEIGVQGVATGGSANAAIRRTFEFVSLEADDELDVFVQLITDRARPPLRILSQFAPRRSVHEWRQLFLKVHVVDTETPRAGFIRNTSAPDRGLCVRKNAARNRAAAGR